jgi:hypothetical protein
MHRALSEENIMAKNNDKVPNKGVDKTKKQTCRTKKSKLRTNSSGLDMITEQIRQIETEENETYNLSVGEILKGASRSATGEFEIEMRKYFEVKAENALGIMDWAEWPTLNLLRQYLLFGAKIAIVEFLMRPETQANVRRFYQKRLRVERYWGSNPRRETLTKLSDPLRPNPIISSVQANGGHKPRGGAGKRIAGKR